jgi:hypothetical protein
MKNKTKSTLALRAHRIRTLTSSELRVANGGVNDSTCGRSCGQSHAVR